MPKTLRGTPTPVLLPSTRQYRFDVQRQLLNHTNPTAVSVGAASTTFGQITRTRDPRRIQIGLKLLF